MITSTMAINKLKKALADAGIPDVKFIQCKFAEVQGFVKTERPDVIVPTGALKDTLTNDVPVVRGTAFVTGDRPDRGDPAQVNSIWKKRTPCFVGVKPRGRNLLTPAAK